MTGWTQPDILEAMNRPPRIEPLEQRRLLSAVFGTVAEQPVGPLTGKIVYTSAGHGLNADGAGIWTTQRGNNNQIVEDFGNQDQLLSYADYLWRAGATVVPMRPVGHQPNEVIVDNINATFTGSWTVGGSTPYFSTTDGSGVSYRVANSTLTETAVARFTPNIPVAGFYPVYAWALTGSNRAEDQLYRVVHSGGATEVKVNHQRVGRGWVYLGMYHFNAGTSGRVEISNKSATAGSAVIADAIRFGNGVGSIARAGRTSGELREDEAALYWIEASAGWTAPGTRVSSSNWRTSTDDGTATVGAPLRWSAYMNAAPFGQSVYLGWHTNAGGGRGTLALWNNPSQFPGTNTTNQLSWAQTIAKEINDDMVALGSPPLESTWPNRTNLTFNSSSFAYGEINGSVNGNEFDATIIEVAFHDNVDDANLLRGPLARDRIGWSAAQGTIRYFNQFGGSALAFAPDAPRNVRTEADRSGNLIVRWDAPTTGVFGGTPTSYRIQSSHNGYGFDGGLIVPGGSTARSYTIPKAQIGQTGAFFRVIAQNAGGASAPSLVVAGRVGDRQIGRVLIVNGFDRFDRSLNVRQSMRISGTFAGITTGTPTTFDRVRPLFSNSFDYVVQHATAIRSFSDVLVGYDSTSNDSVISGAVRLTDYAAVIWHVGEESSADRTFDATERSLITSYLNTGGKLMASGAEIGYELSGLGVASSWLTSTFKASYVGDDANTYNTSGLSSGILSSINLSFDNGQQFYNVDFPDRLAAAAGGAVAMNYSGGTGGGAVVTSQTGATKTVLMGFPFETITSSANRNAVMARVLQFFGFRPVRLDFAFQIDGTGLDRSNTTRQDSRVIDTLSIGETPNILA